jgi:DNA-binding NtrC family response regulator
MAVAAIKLGAFDFIPKPFDLKQVAELVKKATLFNEVFQAQQSLCQDSDKKLRLLGNCPAMERLKGLIQKVAPTEATVLIAGENGTGKELVAHDIYQLSSRSEGPFIKINCAAVSETLMESEFFGHEKGAFTGATERREGRFELANGGTLLLDEVSEIPPKLQAKLLRVLQEREFERVGGSKTLKVDVRILATTNRDMKQAVASGDFREDLYYRLNVFPIHVPPLRERKESIQMLADHFLERFKEKYHREIPGFAPATMEAMKKYKWAGNVRELQNCIERAVIMSGDAPIEFESLGLRSSDLIDLAKIAPPPALLPEQAAPVPAEPAPEPAKSSDGQNVEATSLPTLEEMERTHIYNALKLTMGNRTKAADLLKISIRTLRNKLNEYKLEESVKG